jgi:hypothetical protein
MFLDQCVKLSASAENSATDPERNDGHIPDLTKDQSQQCRSTVSWTTFQPVTCFITPDGIYNTVHGCWLTMAYTMHWSVFLTEFVTVCILLRMPTNQLKRPPAQLTSNLSPSENGSTIRSLMCTAKYLSNLNQLNEASKHFSNKKNQANNN